MLMLKAESSSITTKEIEYRLSDRVLIHRKFRLEHQLRWRTGWCVYIGVLPLIRAPVETALRELEIGNKVNVMPLDSGYSKK
jgi:hypothetical protein